MKVLFTVHDASLRSLKAIFNAIAEQPDVRLRVLSGSGGYNRFRGEYRPKPRLETGDKFGLALGHIRNARKSIFGPFRIGLEWQLVTYRPDVVHVHCEFADSRHRQAIRYKRLLRPSCKLTCSGAENLISPPHTEAARARFDYVCSQTDTVFYWNTEGLAKLISYGLPAEKGCVAYWGVASPVIANSASQRQAIRRQIRSQMHFEDAFVLGYVGQMVHLKGVDVFLHALAQFPTSVKGLLVGDGCDMDRFRSLAGELGVIDRVRFTGWVDESRVFELMAAMDVLVVPSRTTKKRKEQFGRVIAEAMASRVPVIGSDSGAIPEVIGDAGLIFHEDDLDSCVDQIHKLVGSSELRSALADRGLERFDRHFSTSAYARCLTRRWQGLVGQ